MDMTGCTFFLKVGYVAQVNSWVKMDVVERLPKDGVHEAAWGTDVRMITWDQAIGVWHATYGQTYKNLIRWRSPGFDDPVAAYVFAELNQWGM